jgi:hypothetical protein
MEQHTMRLHRRTALRQHEIRRAVWAAERVLTAIDVLDELPEGCLEEVRDFCCEYVRGRTPPPMSEFKKAWVNLIVEHLDQMRDRHKRPRRGLTGLEEQA